MVGQYNGLHQRYSHVPNTRIHWPGGREGPPPDIPECGFTDDNRDCRNKGTFLPLLTVLQYNDTFKPLLLLL